MEMEIDINIIFANAVIGGIVDKGPRILSQYMDAVIRFMKWKFNKEIIYIGDIDEKLVHWDAAVLKEQYYYTLSPGLKEVIKMAQDYCLLDSMYYQDMQGEIIVLDK